MTAEGNVLVGYYIPDFIVEDKIIVQIKALKRLDSSHLAQVIGYLAVTGCPVGLLVNFGTRSLQWRRVLPPRDIAARRVNRQWLFVPDWLRLEMGPETNSPDTSDQTGATNAQSVLSVP